MEDTRLLKNLKHWFELLGKDGTNTKSMVRNDIKHMIDEIESNNTVCGVLVDNGVIKRYELKHEGVESLYKILDCDLVDVMECNIAGHIVDVWFDDEFLLKNNPDAKPSLVFVDEKDTVTKMLWGNVFVCSVDDMGNTISINENVIADILLNAVTTIVNDRTNIKYNVLFSLI